MIEIHRVGATFTVAHRPNGTDSLGDRKGRPYACKNGRRVFAHPVGAGEEIPWNFESSKNSFGILLIGNTMAVCCSLVPCCCLLQRYFAGC